MHLGCTVPDPSKQAGELPRGWMEQALPLHPEDSAEGLQQAASPAGGLAQGQISFCHHSAVFWRLVQAAQLLPI